MAWFEGQLKSVCSQELTDQVPVVVQALTGMLSSSSSLLPSSASLTRSSHSRAAFGFQIPPKLIVFFFSCDVCATRPPNLHPPPHHRLPHRPHHKHLLLPLRHILLQPFRPILLLPPLGQISTQLDSTDVFELYEERYGGLCGGVECC